MKTLCDFLRRHALLLLAALVVLSVPTGVALGKYVKNVEVTNTLNLNVSMVTVEYTIDKNKMWDAIEALKSKPSEIKFVRGDVTELNGLESLSKSGIQDDSLKSGKIGVYQSTDGKTIYIAPMDKCSNVMYAPVDSSWLFCGLSNNKLGLSDSLQTISFDNLDTSKVTDMSSMFKNCYALTSPNLSKLNTSKVTTMASMFDECHALTSLDLSSLDTGNVTSMNNMFYNCLSLTSLNLSGLNTSKVTNMGVMFQYCESLAKLDLSSFDTREVTNMFMMFWMCKKLEKIYVGDGFVTDNTEYADDVFGWCEKLKGGEGTTWGWGKSSLEYARIDKGPNSDAPGYFTSKNANSTTNTATFKNLSNGMNIS